jgi:HAE1 family hydrophobic/amphiphilic exporter-1
MQLQDRSGDQIDHRSVFGQNAYEIIGLANQSTCVCMGVFTQFTASSPQVQSRYQTATCSRRWTSISTKRSSTVGTYLGSSYVNDFTYWRAQLPGLCAG